MEKTKILITDLETTGFSSSKNKIVEAAFVSLDLLDGTTEILFDELICERSLTVEELTNSWIIQNSYMKAEDVLKAESLEFHAEKIQDILNQFPLGITAYNRDFDLRFLDNRGFRYWRELPDPMELAKYICQIVGKNGIKSPSMPEAYRHFFPNDTKFQETHRAGQDAIFEAKIVYRMYELGYFKV